MTNRLVYTSPTTDRKAAFAAADPGAGQAGQSKLAQMSEGYSALPLLFQQLTQSLSVLSGTAELMLEGKDGHDALQGLRVWLHPNARQAELSMHQLRDLRLTKSPALTDLSQSLTVLVLAADMLTQGQLSGADSLMFYGLLRRNADSAITSLAQLRAQLLPESQQATAG
ncbi:MAG TPA: hypothetical protein VKE41_05825 [Roseiflexaceae bacterium]|nr:hypothetical protein [Roseiflexaceae bacterium]